MAVAFESRDSAPPRQAEGPQRQPRNTHGGAPRGVMTDGQKYVRNGAIPLPWTGNYAKSARTGCDVWRRWYGRSRRGRIRDSDGQRLSRSRTDVREFHQVGES